LACICRVFVVYLVRIFGRPIHVVDIARVGKIFQIAPKKSAASPSWASNRASGAQWGVLLAKPAGMITAQFECYESKI
jgi:hypothetical protein